MNLKINKTPDGLKKYPLHCHNNYEIMCYLDGNGYLRTTQGNFDFKKGSIVIVPAGVEHGSVSENGFINISVEGDFHRYFYFDSVVSMADNEYGEGMALAGLIYSNRYGNAAYLDSLCDAYAHYLMQRHKFDGFTTSAVNEIIRKISANAFDSNIDISEILNESDYAEDYIRACFKKETGKTPGEFLTDIRMKHACYLIDIYKNTLSLSEIAERCGYLDYVYFSKKFKNSIGISPRTYKKM